MTEHFASSRIGKPFTAAPLGMDRGTATILLVEDDLVALDGFRRGLEQEGYAVHTAAHLTTARRVLRSHLIDMVVLDVRLPDGSGLDWCAEIRAASMLPVVLISGAGTLDDRLAGLEAGADDYVAKPLSILELSRRIDAILRRAGLRREQGMIEGPGGLCLDAHSGRAVCGEHEVKLTRSETGLLRALIEADGGVVSNEELCRGVWHYQVVGDPNFLHQHASRLRKKLRRLGLPNGTLQTIYGIGYALRLASRTTATHGPLGIVERSSRTHDLRYVGFDAGFNHGAPNEQERHHA